MQSDEDTSPNEANGLPQLASNVTAPPRSAPAPTTTTPDSTLHHLRPSNHTTGHFPKGQPGPVTDTAQHNLATATFTDDEASDEPPFTEVTHRGQRGNRGRGCNRITLHPQNKTAIQYNKSTLRNRPFSHKINAKMR